MQLRRHLDEATGEVVEDPTPREFASVLMELSGGKTHDELSAALYDLVQRVAETGKKGSLDLRVTVSQLDNGAVEMADEIKLRLPEFPRRPTLFFQDRTGNVTRSNPQQSTLPI
jgi:hypothetical protein